MDHHFIMSTVVLIYLRACLMVGLVIYLGIVGTPAVADEIDEFSLISSKVLFLFLFEFMDYLLQSTAEVEQSHRQYEEAAPIDEAYYSKEGGNPWA